MDIKEIEEENRNHVIATIRHIPKSLPSKWQRVGTLSVGGLTHVGFSEAKTGKLVCISSQGQSVIDCESLEVQFEEENYDELNLIAISGILDGEMVSLAGISGGGLRRNNIFGDYLDLVYPDYPKVQVILFSEYSHWMTKPEQACVIAEDYEIKAYGFDKTGKHLVVAGTDVEIYHRV